jgi:hypothetical protein
MNRGEALDWATCGAGLPSDDRATNLGALRWMVDKHQSNKDEQARALWAAKGKQAFEADPATHKRTDRTASAVRR